MRRAPQLLRRLFAAAAALLVPSAFFWGTSGRDGLCIDWLELLLLFIEHHHIKHNSHAIYTTTFYLHFLADSCICWLVLTCSRIGKVLYFLFLTYSLTC